MERNAENVMASQHEYTQTDADDSLDADQDDVELM